MIERELRVGDWYVVAGKGPMKLIEVPSSPLTFSYTFKTDNGSLWDATADQIIAVVDLDFLTMFEKTYSTVMRGQDPYRDTKRTWLAELKAWAKERDNASR